MADRTTTGSPRQEAALEEDPGESPAGNQEQTAGCGGEAVRTPLPIPLAVLQAGGTRPVFLLAAEVAVPPSGRGENAAAVKPETAFADTAGTLHPGGIPPTPGADDSMAAAPLAGEGISPDNLGPSLESSPEMTAALRKAGALFREALAAAPDQDPASTEYAAWWAAARERAENHLRLVLGWDRFNRLRPEALPAAMENASLP